MLAAAFLAGAVHAETDYLAEQWLKTGSKVVRANADFTVGDDLVVTDDASVGGDLNVTGTITNTALTNGLAKLALVFDSLDVDTAGVSATQATITVTCKNIYGDTLAAEKTFQFWFTTYAVSTVPSVEGIESWTYVAHGDVDAYVDLGTFEGVGPGTNMVYIGTTHTDGTMDFLVTADVGTGSNWFFAFGPNGDLSQTKVVYEVP